MTTQLKRFSGAFALGAALALAGCDFGNPATVFNPNLTEDNVLSTPRPLTAWTAGLERQAALALSGTIPGAEILSDNYVNTFTFFNQQFDGLNISYTESDINTMLFRWSDLRESAIFGHQVVAERDADATPDAIAQNYFYEGIANLYLGQLFVGAPLEGGGVPGPPEQLIGQAIGAFDQALATTTDTDARVGYQLARARAYHAIGDRANAVADAQAVLDADADFLLAIRYNENEGSGLSSFIEDAIYDRAGSDDLQPLPRLDFLDPKLALGNDDVAVPLLKAEEASLILIEAALATADLEGAKGIMNDLLALVAARPVARVNDAAEGRTGRPDTEGFEVRASAADPFRSGLVLARDQDVPVPSVSGTSVTADDVAALGTVEDAVETLYLMRQEIFIAEGRRMFDLGVRFPLSENEVLVNSNVELGPLTTPFVPAPLEPLRTQFDDFSTDGTRVTVSVNLNRVLSQNRSDPALVPFF
ncbi:hypothetical protein [Rubrivirga sp.]|uniref:hypothetical protein n=1 Tax=Rubrivirga sp. TaxID=1885344 RepID=UPI003C78E1BF